MYHITYISLHNSDYIQYTTNSILTDSCGSTDLNWNQCLNVMRGIASAIQALQSQPNPIIHNDIKLENIMLDQVNVLATNIDGHHFFFQSSALIVVIND